MLSRQTTYHPKLERVHAESCSCITSILDIGLSNLSFEYITVSLYTMTKTSAIVFLLGFALLLRVEKFRWLQLVVVLCISLGLFLFTFESTQFNATGFIMCLVASIVSGLRWSLTQLIAQKDALGLTNPVDFMYHIQPWMICGLLPAAAVTEGLKFAVDTNFINFPNSLTFFENFGILLVGAFMAFGLEFGEFLLVIKTSSLTLSVSAMFKECAILLIAHWLHGDEVSLINLLGLFCCLAGVAMHVYLKATKAPESSEQTGSSAVAYSALSNLDSASAHSQESEDETVT
ncbi:solute carrier family 35 member C2-like isoform X2 [Watersipora subatra]|uniref:solute carrier family 35 member C2-like isoform X2 n=1 Tax=Watersipora subatra TaxID=2589382 RepID=UPI00355B97AF